MEKNNSKFTVRTLVTASLLIALSVVLTRFLSLSIPVMGSNGLRLGLGTIPIVISGFVLGPFAGAAVGGLSDVIGYLINPMGGVYFPGFTISSMLYGFIPGFVTYYIFKKYNEFSLITSIMFSEIICSMLLNTLWISILYGTKFTVLLPWRAVTAFAMMFIHYVIDGTLLKAIKFNLTKTGKVNFSD